jgi:hypothetical protein
MCLGRDENGFKTQGGTLDFLKMVLDGLNAWSLNRFF